MMERVIAALDLNVNVHTSLSPSLPPLHQSLDKEETGFCKKTRR